MSTLFRTIFYSAIIIVILIAVYFQKKSIMNEREQEKSSVLSILQKEGAPIEVYKADYNDIIETINVSLEKCDPKSSEKLKIRCFYQNAEFVKGLTKDDPVYGIDDKKAIGKILSVGARSVFTGLVQAKVGLNEIAEGNTNLSIVQVGIKKLKNVLSVPMSSINYSKSSAFVWMYNEGQPKKQNITLGAQSSNLVEVKSGLTKGDVVISRGQGLLFMYDHARIIDGANQIKLN